MEDQRAISTEEGQAVANEFDVPFFETSAKEDINVSAAFSCVTRKVKDFILAADQLEPREAAKIRRMSTAKEKKKNCC